MTESIQDFLSKVKAPRKRGRQRPAEDTTTRAGESRANG